MKTIYLAGGCFWGVEKYLSLIPGVMSTSVGYANGKTENPTYEQVCRDKTGHAETVRVEYAPERIHLGFLLSVFYEAIDPTAVNRQGADVGVQYRSGVYYVDAEDEEIIQNSIAALQAKLEEPVTVEVRPLENYFPAEEYHQKYLQKNPGRYCHISWAKLERAKKAVPR